MGRAVDLNQLAETRAAFTQLVNHRTTNALRFPEPFTDQQLSDRLNTQ
jgi:hypothetical protein